MKINSSMEAFEYFLYIRRRRMNGMSSMDAYTMLKSMAEENPDYEDIIMTGVLYTK